MKLIFVPKKCNLKVKTIEIFWININNLTEIFKIKHKFVMNH